MANSIIAERHIRLENFMLVEYRFDSSAVRYEFHEIYSPEVVKRAPGVLPILLRVAEKTFPKSVKWESLKRSERRAILKSIEIQTLLDLEREQRYAEQMKRIAVLGHKRLK